MQEKRTENTETVKALTYSGIETYLNVNGVKPDIHFTLFLKKDKTTSAYNEGYCPDQKSVADLKLEDTGYVFTRSKDQMYNVVSKKGTATGFNDTYFKLHVNLAKTAHVEKTWDLISPLMFHESSPVRQAKYFRHDSSIHQKVKSQLVNRYGEDYHASLAKTKNQYIPVLEIDEKGNIYKKYRKFSSFDEHEDIYRSNDRIINSVQITLYIFTPKDEKQQNFDSYKKLSVDIQNKLREHQILPTLCPDSDFKINDYVSIRGDVDSQNKELAGIGYHTRKKDYMDHPVLKAFIADAKDQDRADKEKGNEDLGNVLVLLRQIVNNSEASITYWKKQTKLAGIPAIISTIKDKLADKDATPAQQLKNISDQVNPGIKKNDKIGFWWNSHFQSSETDQFINDIKILLDSNVLSGVGIYPSSYSIEERLRALNSLTTLSDKINLANNTVKPQALRRVL